jgi:hypothetical protein
MQIQLKWLGMLAAQTTNECKQHKGRNDTSKSEGQDTASECACVYSTAASVMPGLTPCPPPLDKQHPDLTLRCGHGAQLDSCLLFCKKSWLGWAGMGWAGRLAGCAAACLPWRVAGCRGEEGGWTGRGWTGPGTALRAGSRVQKKNSLLLYTVINPIPHPST